MAVNWPTYSAGVTAVTTNGVTSTMRWGTAGSFVNAIVEDISEAEKTETYYVPNGDGIEGTRFILKHGYTWDVTCDDTGAAFSTPPYVGQLVVMNNILTGTGANSAMSCANVNAVVLDNNYRGRRKQPGQRVLRVETLTLIEGGMAVSGTQY